MSTGPGASDGEEDGLRWINSWINKLVSQGGSQASGCMSASNTHCLMMLKFPVNNWKFQGVRKSLRKREGPISSFFFLLFLFGFFLLLVSVFLL